MYRPHRFSYRHVLREVGAAGRDIYSLADVAQTEDIARLADDQADRRYTLPGTAGWRVVADRSVVPDRFGPARLIIPAGHNLGDESVWVRTQQANTLGSWNALLGLGITGSGYHLAHDGGMIDIEYDPTSTAEQRYLALHLGPAVSNAAALGEVTWSDVWQPTTGEVFSWEHPAPESNVTTNVMQSGNSYTSENGPAVRRFAVEHRGVSDADLAGYSRLFRAVGQGRPFWYEHSDSGDHAETIEPFSSVAGLTLINATAGLVSSSTGEANGAIEVTPTGGDVYVARDFAAPVDFRGRRASIDLRVNAADATTLYDVQINLIDTGGTVSLAWLPSLAFGGTSGDNWARVYFDPSRPDVISGTGAIDLGAVPRWQIAITGAPANPVRIDNFILYDPEKAPVLCRFASVSPRRQDNPVPRAAAGPSYTIGMELLEVRG